MLKWIYTYLTLTLLSLTALVQAQKNVLPFSPAAISAIPLYNTSQKDSVHIKWENDNTMHLFVFLSPDCPLCRNYAPLINKIEAIYNKKIKVYGIIPGRSYNDSLVNEFIHTFSVQYPLLKDPQQMLKKYLKASTTPEVYLLNNAGVLLYQGAIDNWAVSLGKKRVKATENYLLDAVNNSLNNIPVAVKYKQPVGCLINDY